MQIIVGLVLLGAIPTKTQHTDLLTMLSRNFSAKAAIDRALQCIAEDNDSGVHYRVILLTHSDETLSFADQQAL